MWWADIEVAIRAVDMDSRARLLCYPRGSFYPLSSVPPTKHQRITKTYFRTCLSRHSRSQAGFCHYTFSTMSIRAKPTFVPLRYSLARYRPSKTAHLALSPSPYSGDSGKTCHALKRGVSLALAHSSQDTKKRRSEWRVINFSFLFLWTHHFLLLSSFPPCYARAPSYTKQLDRTNQCQAAVKLHGVFLSWWN